MKYIKALPPIVLLAALALPISNFPLSIACAQGAAASASQVVFDGASVNINKTSGAGFSKPASHRMTCSTSIAAIPFDQIGSVAGKSYSGKGLSVTSSPIGARLRCVFQRLNAHVTTNGLWLVSTKKGSKGEPFRVVACALGRATSKPLSPCGQVEVNGKTAWFIRPGLTEEYSVGINEVRQDFVIKHRPSGNGPVRLKLELNGAKAEAMPDGARLVLADSGRQMVYYRLTAEDARGLKLPAKLEVLSANRLAIVLDDATAQYPVRIDPTFSDANWISLGGLPGASGPVYAVAVDGTGNLYIGGNFSIAGNTHAMGIAEWNGSSWSSLGSGISDPVSYTYGPDVYALAVSGTNLYAGGDFTNAGGISANYIAKWNGSSWSALGSGMHYFVYALAVSGTNLYAAGSFTTVGGVSANNIARWDGSNWSSLGSGVNGEADALAMSGGTLYAGGYFTTAGTHVSGYVAEAFLGGASPEPPFLVTTNGDFGFTKGSSLFGFDVSAPGEAGLSLVIEASTNLVDWLPLQTNVLGASPWYFSDPNVTNFARRFYRAELNP